MLEGDGMAEKWKAVPKGRDTKNPKLRKKIFRFYRRIFACNRSNGAFRAKVEYEQDLDHKQLWAGLRFQSTTIRPALNLGWATIGVTPFMWWPNQNYQENPSPFAFKVT
ncbi:hypothetical protein Q3G72_018079 [Acer saccharum]|nr:hypothetical protein Q3G72_018079 [Acer saccharum]